MIATLVDQLLWGKVDPCGTCGNYTSGYYHLDFLGSSVMTTNEAGNGSGGYDIIETYRYDEYGQPYFFLHDGTSLTASLAGQPNLYTGREWDGELSRYYYRARYYDQTSGRFLGRDPIVPPSLNLYSYVDSQPLSNVDPMGFEKAIANSAVSSSSISYAGDDRDDRMYKSKISVLGCMCDMLVLVNSRYHPGEGKCTSVSIFIECPPDCPLRPFGPAVLLRGACHGSDGNVVLTGWEIPVDPIGGPVTLEPTSIRLVISYPVPGILVQWRHMNEDGTWSEWTTDPDSAVSLDGPGVIRLS